MSDRAAKLSRQWLRSVTPTIFFRPEREAKYHWIRRPDGSVVRQLQAGCGRAVYQLLFKGKGKHRVQAVQRD